MLNRTLALTLALVGLYGLAGCGDQTAAKPDASATATAKAASTGTAASTAAPAGTAKKDDSSGW